MSLTTAEAATALGITEPAVRKLVQRGRLAPLQPGARPLRFHEHAVAALLPARWRRQQRAAGPDLDGAWAEVDDLVAAQVRGVSRCGHAEPSRQPVEGTATARFPAAG